MANHDSDQDRPGRILNLEVPGDTNSADIVDRTGEQMPKQAHDGVTDDDRERSTRVNDDDVGTERPTQETALTPDNPGAGRI